MSTRAHFELDEGSTAFVSEQLAAGRYLSADEVVRAGLDLLRERDDAVEKLRAALIEGEESGPARPFDFEAFLASKRGDAASRP